MTQLKLEARATSRELGASYGYGLADGTFSIPLRDLQELGLVEHNGARPAIWRYTDAGRVKAAQIIAEDERSADAGIA